MTMHHQRAILWTVLTFAFIMGAKQAGRAATASNGKGTVQAGLPGPAPSERGAELLRRAYSGPPSDAEVARIVLEGMRDPSASVRRDAAFALSTLAATDEGRSALVGALDDVDPEVRGAAAWSLATVSTVPSVALAALQRNVAEVTGTARLFTTFALARALGNGSVPEQERRFAAVAVIPGLMATIGAQDSMMVARIARGIAEVDALTAEALVPTLVSLSTSDDVRLSGNARIAGKEIGEGLPQATALPLRLMTDQDPRVRAFSGRTLGLLRVGNASTTLTLSSCSIKQTEPEEVRIACVEALQLFGPSAKDASPRLRSLVEDSNGRIARAALHALLSVDPESLADEASKLERRHSPLAAEAKAILSLKEVHDLHPRAPSR